MGNVDAPESMRAVPAALPGSRSGDSIVTLADSWHYQVAYWRTGLLNHATHLATSADSYAASETAAAEVFSSAGAGGQERY